MDLKEIKKRIDTIYLKRDDDEAAHVLEDELQSDFIKYISKTGTKEQRKMARAIMKVDDVDFTRHCA